MRGTVNQLARTLALANRFITEQLEQHGLAGIAPSHGDSFVQLFAHGASWPSASAVTRPPLPPS